MDFGGFVESINPVKAVQQIGDKASRGDVLGAVGGLYGGAAAGGSFGMPAGVIGSNIGSSVGSSIGGATFGNPFPTLPGPNPAEFKDYNAEANKKLLEQYRNQMNQQAGSAQANQLQARGSQGDLASILMAQARGQNPFQPTGPSVAELQMQRGLDQGRQQLASQAASQQGVGAGLGARQLARGQAQLGQQVVGDAALLRAQEDAQNRQMAQQFQQQSQAQLGQLLGQQRGMDQQEAAQANQLVQQYLQLGLGIDQAQFLAQQNMEKLRIEAATGRRASEMQLAGGLLGAIGSGVGGYLGMGK